MAEKEQGQPAISDQVEKEVEDTELSDEELDEASGGIIIVGGKPAYTRQSIHFSLQAPPEPDLNLSKVKNLGGPDT